MPVHHRTRPRQVCEWHAGSEGCSAAAFAQASVAFDRLLADLSAWFIDLPIDEIDGAITDSLRRISEVLGVDRTQLIRFREGRHGPRVTHSGAVHGNVEGSPGRLSTLFPWAISHLKSGRIIAFSGLEELPKAAATDRATYERHGVKAGLAVPLNVAGEIEGCIALDCTQAERTWPPDLIGRMEVMVKIFGSALAHKRAREDLDAAIHFERTASDILSALLAAPRDEHDCLLEAGLRSIAQAFGADRATLWRRADETNSFVRTHRGIVSGLLAPPDAPRSQTLPWIAAQLDRGLVVRINRNTNHPAEADADLEALQSWGIGAAMVVPLLFSGKVTGALSIATTREDPDWPQALMPRAQLLGEAVASFLARQSAERREQEAQAQATHAARVGSMGVFAATLVHELTQPLAASRANAETAADLLSSNVPPLDELRAIVADIVADGRRASDVIQRLRRFLRHGEAERVELDVGALLSEVLTFAKAEAVDRGIEVTLDIPSVAPSIVGDRVQLQQVLLNLLLNAFDAVSACGPGMRKVTVCVRPSESGVSVDVTDCGPGIDSPTIARLFQPFFTTKPGGMGLGLSISKTIVASHGGTLCVSSGSTRGTTFRVELPSRQLLVITPSPHLELSTNAGGTVFVIDDDETMRRAIERQLESAGYDVQAFPNAHAFLDQKLCAGVACIVSDVRMPGMNGLDLQAALARAGHEWPIVFISGHADIPMTVHVMKAGAVAVLPKPFAKPELLAAVADALARSHARDQDRIQDAEILASHASLTLREREVLALVVAGLMNKIVADRLGISEPTVKIHRGRMMKKMRARSIADLTRMAQRIASHGGAGPDRTPKPVGEFA